MALFISASSKADGISVADDQRHARKRKRAPAQNTHQHTEHREPQREQAYVKNVMPKSEGQARLIEAIERSNLVLALGPAGTGKTYLAIARAVEALRAGKIGRIVLCRPAVDAGENIGFLPGDMEEKLAPDLRPLYDALQDRMSAKQVKAMIAEGQIEIASVGFMRGRHAQQRFHRRRRGAELHLRPAQDDPHAPRLEFEDDRHRGPGTV